MSTSLDVMKEVDSFIQQAKLEGDISCSNSSVGSNCKGTTTQPIVKSVRIHELFQLDNLDDTVNNAEDVTFCTCNDAISENNDAKFTSNKNTTHVLDNDKLIDCDVTEYHEIKDVKYNSQESNESSVDLDVSKRTELEDKPLITRKCSTVELEKHANNSRSENKNFEGTNKYVGSREISKKRDNDSKSCDSSFVDLGNSSYTSKVPYVMWLQEQRSKQSIISIKYESSDTHREGVHLHNVNSALFWERWMDYMFQTFDKWINYSSESEDEDLRMMRRRSLNEFRTSQICSEQANRAKSEPILRRKSGEKTQLKNMRYKCPSYVDWLIQRRQERIKSESDLIPEKEVKVTKNYWSSLYGKLTNSLSSILFRKSKEDEQCKERPQTAPLLTGSPQRSPSSSPEMLSMGLRKAYSQTCGHRYNSKHNRIRYRHLTEEPVESPVLTDQLVELVCNTLSPETSEDSSNDENLRRRKWSHKRTIKRKS